MDGCIPIEALGTLDALSPDDPRRRHVAQCARCSALLDAYREFARAEAPAGARVHDAERHLAAFIARRIEGAESCAGAPRRRWFEMPVLRFAAAAAVVVIAIAVAERLRGPEETVLRGDPSAAIRLEVPRAAADGSIELRWTPIADADAYVVVLLRGDLSEVARVPAADEARATLDRSALTDEVTRWQVIAFREGAVLAESSPEVLAE